jgi:L-amino acid N-acyltransferase YncA
VIKDDSGKVVGFGFLHAYHAAGTFQKTAEVTYFILPDHTRKGLGEVLLEKFKQEAKKRSINHILAAVSSLNQKSLQFHRKNRFYECGRLRKIGKKFGQDFDVVYLQLDL